MRGKLACLTFLCLWLVKVTLSARILVLSPLGPRSHIHAFMPLVEELANREHELTVITAYSPKTNHPNIREIVIPEMLELVNFDWYDFRRHSSLWNSVKVFQIFVATQSSGYRIFIANRSVQEYLRNLEVDLVIMDGIANDFVIPFIDYLQVPFVSFDPGSGTPWNTWSQGVDRDYAFIPPGTGDVGSDMTFFQRLINMIGTETAMLVRQYYLLSVLDNLAKKDFPNSRPISEIEKSAAFCFVNNHPITFWSRNLPATVIQTSAMHVRPPQPLPSDLQEFVDGAKHGFIVFTLGSNSQVSRMPEAYRAAFVSAFSRIQQRVIWKWEAGEIPGLSSNVKLVNWLPQQDLLGHEKARLFISHGGLMGLQEAIYHAVPVLGLPLGRDQTVLLIKASSEGYAVKMEWDDLTEEALYNALHKLISDHTYKANATRMSKMMRDVLVPGKEAGAYWIEYLLRHGSVKHLQTRSKDMPLYQVYMLDVWAFLIAILLFTIATTKAALGFCNRNPKKVKKN